MFIFILLQFKTQVVQCLVLECLMSFLAFHLGYWSIILYFRIEFPQLFFIWFQLKVNRFCYWRFRITHSIISLFLIQTAFMMTLWSGIVPDFNTSLPIFRCSFTFVLVEKDSGGSRTAWFKSFWWFFMIFTNFKQVFTLLDLYRIDI